MLDINEIGLPVSTKRSKILSSSERCSHIRFVNSSKVIPGALVFSFVTAPGISHMRVSAVLGRLVFAALLVDATSIDPDPIITARLHEQATISNFDETWRFLLLAHLQILKRDFFLHLSMRHQRLI